LALVTFVFLARKVCIVGVIKIENLMEDRGGEEVGEEVEVGADWLPQRRNRSWSDHAALRRTPMHGRRCKRRPSSQHGDLVDLGGTKDKRTSYIVGKNTLPIKTTQKQMGER
jgi:hypothetical protein